MSASFSAWPNFTEKEAEKAKEVLLSNKVNRWTGQECIEFEKEFAQYTDTKKAIALANGTVALDLALIGLGIGPGDEVIVTSRTFLASVSSIVNAGATPVFADVDIESQNITPSTTCKLITPKTKAILCVHLAGWPCEMDDFVDLAQTHNLFLIEDCAQAHGAQYKGKSVGSFGDVAAWSFCQDKIMTTGGEGGMVTTNNDALWRKMWAYKDHGKDYETVFNHSHPPGFRWLHNSFGTNWRMTEIQAAIGRIQIEYMTDWHEKRLRNFQQLSVVCRDNKNLRTPIPPSHIEHGAYKFYTFIVPENLKPGWSRSAIIDAINAKGVPCMQGSCSEVYLEKAFDSTKLAPSSRLPNARTLGETSLMFMIHPTITSAELKLTADTITAIINSACES